MGTLNFQDEAIVPGYALAPQPGALAEIYVQGTDTLARLYSDPDLTSTIANPVKADSFGVFSPCHLQNGVYRLVMRSYYAEHNDLNAWLLGHKA
jgi:hypothetical protein